MKRTIPSGLVILGLMVGTLLAIGWLADEYPAVGELAAIFGIR
jgi:hypothetical protein